MKGLTKKTATAGYWALVMLIVILLGILGRIVLSYAACKLTTSMVRDMRNDIYDKLQRVFPS